MNKQEKENLIKMHVELLAVAKVVANKVMLHRESQYWPTVRSVYDKLFAMELHKINLQVQKGLTNKIPNVDAMFSKLFGGKE